MRHKDKIFALFTRLRDTGKEIRDDNITVYAAQASFFVIISTMPFLSLLVSILSFFVSTDILSYFEKYALPDEVLALVGSVIDELHTAPTVSLLSFSAVIILWTASKGILLENKISPFTSRPGMGRYMNGLCNMLRRT